MSDRSSRVFCNEVRRQGGGSRRSDHLDPWMLHRKYPVHCDPRRLRSKRNQRYGRPDGVRILSRLLYITALLCRCTTNDCNTMDPRSSAGSLVPAAITIVPLALMVWTNFWAHRIFSICHQSVELCEEKMIVLFKKRKIPWGIHFVNLFLLG